MIKNSCDIGLELYTIRSKLNGVRLMKGFIVPFSLPRAYVIYGLSRRRTFGHVRAGVTAFEKLEKFFNEKLKVCANASYHFKFRRSDLNLPSTFVLVNRLAIYVMFRFVNLFNIPFSPHNRRFLITR